MPLIRRRLIPLPFENMSQMAPTITANNLRPRHSKRFILVSRYRTWNAIEEGWPSAAGFEFVGGAVEGRIAGDAVIGSRGGGMFIVGAGVGGFSSFFADYAELFW